MTSQIKSCPWQRNNTNPRSEADSHGNPGSHPLYLNARRSCEPPLSHPNACACAAPHLARTSSLHLVFHGTAYNDAWAGFHAIERGCPSSAPNLPAALQPTFRNIARFNKHHIRSGPPLVGMRCTAGRTHRSRRPWASLTPRAQQCPAATATEE